MKEQEPSTAKKVSDWSPMESQGIVNLEPVAMVETDDSMDGFEILDSVENETGEWEAQKMVKEDTIEDVARELCNFILLQQSPLLISDFPELCRDGSLPTSLLDESKFGFSSFLGMLEECAKTEDFEVIYALDAVRQNGEYCYFTIDPINPEHWRWLFKKGFIGEQDDSEPTTWTKVPRNLPPKPNIPLERVLVSLVSEGDDDDMPPRIDEAGSLPSKKIEKLIKIESLSVSELANMLALTDGDLDDGAAIKLEDLQNRAQLMDGPKLEGAESVPLSTVKTIEHAIMNKPGYCFSFQRSNTCCFMSCTYCHKCSNCHSTQHGAKSCPHWSSLSKVALESPGLRLGNYLKSSPPMEIQRDPKKRRFRRRRKTRRGNKKRGKKRSKLNGHGASALKNSTRRKVPLQPLHKCQPTFKTEA